MNYIKKISKNKKRFIDVPYEELLEKSAVIDLKDNAEFIEIGNGYIEIKPIYNAKLFKKPN